MPHVSVFVRKPKKTWPQQSSIPCRLERFSSAIRPQSSERVPAEATHKTFSHIFICFGPHRVPSTSLPTEFLSFSHVSSVCHRGMKRIAKESVWSFSLGNGVGVGIAHGKMCSMVVEGVHMEL